MIYEYAVDPRIAASWFETDKARFFKAGIGIGNPRIVSLYPSTWDKLVWKEFIRYGRHKDLDSNKMEAVLKYLCYRAVRRSNRNWNSDKSWLENAETEHNSTPFDAIISKDNPRNHERVICVDSIDDDTPVWYRRRQVTVRREAKTLERCVSPMLRIATKIVFVDPYFGTRQRYLETMRCYFSAIHRSASDVNRFPDIEICRAERGQDFARSQLAEIIPSQLKLVVRTLRERYRGEALHNRYILTDKGGLYFGYGLDEMQRSHDDLSLLDRCSYLTRWNQYADGARAFKQVKKERIVGRFKV